MRTFCPKCGRATEKFYENLCADCFLKKKSNLSILPDKITYATCKICGSLYLEERLFENLEELIEQFLKNKLSEKNVKDVTYRIHDGKVEVSITSEFLGLEKNESKTVNLVHKVIICKNCSLKSLGYFQSILQIRFPKEKMAQVLSDIQEQLKKREEETFVSKFEKHPNGFDIYLSSAKSANDIAKTFKNKYKAKLKITKKLITRSHGKDIYRDTILISIGE